MDLTDKKMLYISYFRNSFGSFHPSHPNHISIYCYLLTKHHKLLQDYFIIMNSNSSNLFNQKHILLVIPSLFRWHKYSTKWDASSRTWPMTACNTFHPLQASSLWSRNRNYSLKTTTKKPKINRI